jgi:hypothetical protein
MISYSDIPSGKDLLWQFDYDCTHDLLFLDGGKVGKGIVKLYDLHEWQQTNLNYQYNFLCYPFNQALVLIDRCNFNNYDWCEDYGIKWYDALLQYTNIPNDCIIEGWEYWKDDGFPCPKTATFELPKLIKPVVLTYLYRVKNSYNNDMRGIYSAMNTSPTVYAVHSHLIPVTASETTIEVTLDDLAICSVVVFSLDDDVSRKNTVEQAIKGKLPKGWDYSNLDSFLSTLKSRIDNTIDTNWLQSYTLNTSVSVAHWQREQDTSNLFSNATGVSLLVDGFLTGSDSYIAFGITETRTDNFVPYPHLNKYRGCYIYAYPVHNDYLKTKGFDSSKDKWSDTLYFSKIKDDLYADTHIEKYDCHIGKHDVYSPKKWVMFYGISHDYKISGEPFEIHNIMAGAELIEDPKNLLGEPYLPNNLAEYSTYPYFQGDNTENNNTPPYLRNFPKTGGSSKISFFVTVIDRNLNSRFLRYYKFRVGVVFFEGSNDSSGRWTYNYYYQDFQHNFNVTATPTTINLGSNSYTYTTYQPDPSHIGVETVTLQGVKNKTLELHNFYKFVDGVPDITQFSDNEYYFLARITILLYENNMDTMKIKEIHQALNADKYAWIDNNGTAQPATHSLGWKLEKIAQSLGINFSLNGQISSIRQSKEVPRGKNIPAGWYFAQFGTNNCDGQAHDPNDFSGQNGGLKDEERLGIVYQIKSNQIVLNKDDEPIALKQGSYVLCESLPQYLELLQRDLDKAIDWQNLGGGLMTFNGKTQVTEGLFDVLQEISVVGADTNKTTEQNRIAGLITQQLAKEILKAIGLPTEVKKFNFAIESEDPDFMAQMKAKKVTYEVPYNGVAEESPTLVTLFLTLLENIALGNIGVIKLNELEAQKNQSGKLTKDLNKEIVPNTRAENYKDVRTSSNDNIEDVLLRTGMF